jgi:hypothetical protein
MFRETVLILRTMRRSCHIGINERPPAVFDARGFEGVIVRETRVPSSAWALRLGAGKRP